MFRFRKRAARKEQSQSESSLQRSSEEGSAHDKIRPLAYRKWEEAGRPDSDGSQFWAAAEQEILRPSRK